MIEAEAGAEVEACRGPCRPGLPELRSEFHPDPRLPPVATIAQSLSTSSEVRLIGHLTEVTSSGSVPAFA